MTALLAALARLAARRPRALLALAAAVSLAAILPLRSVRFDTDVARLLPTDDARVRAFLDAKDLVAEPGAVHVLLEVDDGEEPAAPGPAGDGTARTAAVGGAPAPPPAAGSAPPVAPPPPPPRVAALAAFAEAWGAAVSSAPGAGGRPLAREVEVRVPERYERFVREVLSRSGFLYLDGDDLEEALARLSDDAIRAAVREARARLDSAAPPQLARALAEDPLGLHLLFARRIGRGLGAPRLDSAGGHLVSEDGRALLARVVGDRGAGDVAYARALMDALRAAEPAGDAAAAPLLPPGARIRASYAGAYPITLENERSIRRDIWLTFGGSFVLVVAIFVHAFRRPRTLLFAALPLGAGLLWTFSILAAARGAIGVATTGFASVVVGLAVDYAIHIVARYLRERREGAAVEPALEAAVASSGAGIVPAALMTVAAFLAFRWTSFPGLAELGTLAALGMAVCLVTTLLVLPPLLALTGRRAPDEARPVSGYGLARLWDLACGRPRAILAACGAATLAALAALALAPGPAVRLETDIRNLLPRGDTTAATQEAIGRRFGVGADAALVLARGEDEEEVLARLAEADRVLERRSRDGIVAAHESPARWLPPRAAQERALARLAEVDPLRVERTLRAALAADGFTVARLEGSIARLREQLRPAVVTRAALEGRGLGRLLHALTPASPDRPALGLATATSAAGRRAAAGLPEALAATPGVVVTGVPVVVEALVAALERDFALATGGASAAVLAIALGHFRRLRPALLAVLPAYVGFLWMLAVMKLLDVPVNFLNVIVFPMVIGIEDNSVHILHRAREPGAGGVRRVLDEIGLALFLCTATSLLGFGSLVLSDNRGLASIGAATIIGKLACWVTGTVALPAWLALRERAATRA